MYDLKFEINYHNIDVSPCLIFVHFIHSQSIIYYTVRSPKLEQWLNDDSIRQGISGTLDKTYVDLDPIFTASVDEDYDSRVSGVSKNSFCNVYYEWIQYCASRRDKV